MTKVTDCTFILSKKKEPTAIAVGPRGLHAGPGCRRGLVVEVAPGVVDASAVALPSSHVIPDVAESDALVFHWDPDEDDELDALSRDATDALGVGHADLQRPTQADRDVSGAVVHHDLTLIDSSDDDAPFIVPRPAPVFVRPSRRGVGPRGCGGSTGNPGP